MAQCSVPGYFVRYNTEYSDYITLFVTSCIITVDIRPTVARAGSPYLVRELLVE